MRVGGVDVARTGEDQSVMIMRDDYNFIALEKWTKASITESAGRVERLCIRHKLDSITVDADGLGAGLVDILRERGLPVIAFHGMQRCDRRDETGELSFLNMRSYAWWNMRCLLDPRNSYNVTLPRDDDLISDLCAPKWEIRSGSVIKVESKDEIKKRIHRSPDAGDAAIYCYCSLDPSVFEENYAPYSRRDIEKLNRPTEKPKGEYTQEWIDNFLWKDAHKNHNCSDW